MPRCDAILQKCNLANFALHDANWCVVGIFGFEEHIVLALWVGAMLTLCPNIFLCICICENVVFGYMFFVLLRGCINEFFFVSLQIELFMNVIIFNL